VREAVIVQLDALNGAKSPLPEAVKACTLHEPVPDLRRLLFAAWREREGSASLLAAVARTRREDLALEALDSAAEEEPPLPWAAVAGIADIRADKVLQRIFSLFQKRLNEMPLGWLLKYLSDRRWVAAFYGTQLLPRLAEVRSLAADDRAALAAIARIATEELSEPLDHWDDEENGDWDEWHSKLEALVAEAQRLCGGDALLRGGP
jgi:hypothetical protein